MIRTITILLIASCLIFLSDALSAQSYNLLWDKTYGGDSRDWNSSVSTDNFGGLFIVGDSQSEISGDIIAFVKYNYFF